MSNYRVTSKNRGAAKRMLNVWHDAADVRTWTLARLRAELDKAINQGLTTVEAVRRALDAEENDSKPKNDASSGKSGDSDAGKPDKGADDSDDASKASASGDGDDGSGEAADDDASGDSDASTPGDNEDGQNAELPPVPSPSDVPPNMPFVTHDELNASNAAVCEALGQHTLDTARKVLDVTGAAMDKLSDDVAKALAKATAASQDAKPVTVTVEFPDGKAQKIEGAHCMLPTVLKYVTAGQNVALVGPAGTGKSTIVQMIAKALGKEFRGCGALLSKYDLVGFVDASGNYQPTPLFEAYTEGHLFCFDELDASAPDAVVAFNAITDNQNVYAFPHGMFTKHQDFVAVACLNTYGNGASADYVGRFKQDAAAMSRFIKVYIDYDPAIEKQLGDADIVARVHAIRKACGDLSIRHIVSTRMITQAQAGRNAGASKAELDRDIFFSGLDDSAVKQIKAKIGGAS